jgi:hypothetical protein
VLVLFIHPMWDHESQRIGKQKCTPAGYKLHQISDTVAMVGLLLFLAVLAYLGYAWFVGTFHASLLWLLAAPFGVDFAGDVLYHYSWLLAKRKGLHYDYERCEASWLEAGERKTLRYASEPKDAP